MSSRLPTPSRESYSEIEVPVRPASAIVQEALSDIDVALSQLRAYGVRVPHNSRLEQARAVLQDYLNTGRLVPGQRRDDLGLRSLETAFDYSAIAATLPATPIASVRRELALSLNGPLDPPDSDRGPSQLQSQFILRAALVRGGLSPSHPTYSSRRGGRTPDMVVENGNCSYGIEAKRPRLERNVLQRFDEGVAQIASFGLTGAVLIDVSDCVRGLERPVVDAEVRRLALIIYDRLFIAGQGHRAGYEHIFVAGTYARVAWAAEEHGGEAMILVHSSSTVGIFARARGTLLDHRARWLRVALDTGLTGLGRTLVEARVNRHAHSGASGG